MKLREYLAERDFETNHPYATNYLRNAKYSVYKGINYTQIYASEDGYEGNYEHWENIEEDGIHFYDTSDGVELIIDSKALYHFALKNATYMHIEDEDGIWRENKMTLSNEAYKSLHIDSNDTKTTK